MIRFQIIERAGANLHKTLVDAMRAGELRTFEATRRGRRIQHKNRSCPSWIVLNACWSAAVMVALLVNQTRVEAQAWNAL